MRLAFGFGISAKGMVVIAMMITPTVQAAQEAASVSDYPELQVTPRATERVEREVRLEEELGWVGLPQLQVPSLALLTTASVLALNNTGASYKRTTEGVAAAGIGIGAVGLIGSTWISRYHRPMRDARDELKNEGASKPREQLARERYAEEALRKSARTLSIYRWSLGLLSLGASAGAISQAGGDAFVLGGGAVAAATSLLPLLFPTRWETVACEQELYKKKIYGPVGSQWRLDPVVVPSSDSETRSALQLSWNYRF